MNLEMDAQLALKYSFLWHKLLHFFLKGTLYTDSIFFSHIFLNFTIP